MNGVALDIIQWRIAMKIRMIIEKLRAILDIKLII